MQMGPKLPLTSLRRRTLPGSNVVTQTPTARCSASMVEDPGTQMLSLRSVDSNVLNQSGLDSIASKSCRSRSVSGGRSR